MEYLVGERKQVPCWYYHSVVLAEGICSNVLLEKMTWLEIRHVLAAYYRWMTFLDWSLLAQLGDLFTDPADGLEGQCIHT